MTATTGHKTMSKQERIEPTPELTAAIEALQKTKRQFFQKLETVTELQCELMAAHEWPAQAIQLMRSNSDAARDFINAVV